MDDTGVMLLLVFIIFILVVVGIVTYLDYKVTIKAMELGYEQVLVPGKSSPIWRKINDN